MRRIHIINPLNRQRLLSLLFVQPNEGLLTMQSSLIVRRHRVNARYNPKLDDFGIVSRKVITTAGVNYMRDDFAAAAGSADITNFKYHGNGTGATAEAIGDTALGVEVETRGTGTQVAFAAKQYQSVGTVSITATRAITEHGIFSASTTGTLWDRSIFTAINAVNGDSITYTYTLTLSDGG